MSDETLEEPKFSELTEHGIKFYKEKIKPLLEPKHNGEFIAIEPYSGKYFLNKIIRKRYSTPARKCPTSLSLLPE